MNYQYSESFALEMDQKDPLAKFRDQFIFPQVNGEEAIYFCGNSLGLQPKTVRNGLDRELQNWAKMAVDGHFHGEDAWFYAKNKSKPALAEIMGAHEHEVVAMNNLSVNLHLLMVSFYRPTSEKYKIIVEAGAFPSDQYMLETQVKFHGLNPEEVIVELKPRAGEHTLRTEDIVAEIKKQGDALALVNMAGIQYYSGQLFDLEAITKAAHEVGAYAGFDLAHAAGNALLKLHDWDVDFATWCSYKYMNSGPGNISGIYVHERFAERPDIPRFAGWWGHDEGQRFKMEKGFLPMFGADGWQLANTNILALAAHQASLDIFMEAGIENLRNKSVSLTGYLEYLIREISGESGILEIITPENPSERGCQLSLLIHRGGKAVFDEWYQHGVVGDWRNPNVIRLAPTPLYNSYMDVFRFAKILEQSIKKFA
ncbi:kynureninase [Algoriphagus zhangzhouensis]|uniref:Kynureninase n=1 Tax=Algoriphagus zhangzhouensis TaxID=1073327 RepID=A0A1M7ZB52_9BACT|nr:kynureninase [Algoriphagus zhangzhouensis]TDY46992.1 kynureninase [Algoriphagus zhangzhouensis]SHO62049.1 Kynureninase [Algoriphagus zhangzhouensis]